MDNDLANSKYRIGLVLPVPYEDNPQVFDCRNYLHRLGVRYHLYSLDGGRKHYFEYEPISFNEFQDRNAYLKMWAPLERISHPEYAWGIIKDRATTLTDEECRAAQLIGFDAEADWALKKIRREGLSFVQAFPILTERWGIFSNLLNILDKYKEKYRFTFRLESFNNEDKEDYRGATVLYQLGFNFSTYVYQKEGSRSHALEPAGFPICVEFDPISYKDFIIRWIADKFILREPVPPFSSPDKDWETIGTNAMILTDEECDNWEFNKTFDNETKWIRNVVESERRYVEIEQGGLCCLFGGADSNISKFNGSSEKYWSEEFPRYFVGKYTPPMCMPPLNITLSPINPPSRNKPTRKSTKRKPSPTDERLEPARKFLSEMSEDFRRDLYSLLVKEFGE